MSAFSKIDSSSQSPTLTVLRRRLVGELFGDADIVAQTLDPAFEVTMHSGGSSATLPGSVVVQGVEFQRTSGVLMWVDFDDLVVGEGLIAGHGLMCSLLSTQKTLTTVPIGIFLRFGGSRMTSEVVFMGESQTAELAADDEIPSPERLRSHLELGKVN